MMRVEIRADSVSLDGYVNVVGRDSRPILSARGEFVEQVRPKTFQRALERAGNVDLCFDHRRKVGSTKENLQLYEDNVGLRALCTVTDPAVIEKARRKELRGWSFGFRCLKDDWEKREALPDRRYLEDIELREVSILDITPAYVATSIEQRAGTDSMIEYRANLCAGDVEYIDRQTPAAQEQRSAEDTPGNTRKQQVTLLKLKRLN